MKNFFKKLAFVLALAMVVASVAPAATASAAAAPKLNRSSKVLYIGGDVTGDYTDNIDLNVKNKGNNTVSYSTADAAIATVDAVSGVVTAKAVGYTTIKATLKDKDTKKVSTTLTAKIWVKQNADSVGLGSLAKVEKPLVVGDKVKINAYRMLNSVKYWKQADKSVVTDYITWTSSNTDAVKVDSWGTLTAVAPGEATITIVAVQPQGKTATTETKEFKVSVVAKGITDVKQLSATKVEVSFGAAQDDTMVTKDTVTLTPADTTKATPIVKNVTFNDTKTVATVELYVSLDDKVTYTVAVKDTDSKKDFTASVGKVASVTITGPAAAVAGDAAKIKYTLYDANGVALSADDAKVTVSFVANETNGFLSKNADGNPTVTVFEKGKTVSIQLEYHTGEYSNEGVETTFKSNAFVVTGVDKTDATIAASKYSVVKGDYEKADFDNVKTQITMNDFDYAIEAYVKDSSDNEYKTTGTTATDFKYESLDTTKVEVDADGKLYPVSVGVAYVKVTVTPINKSFLVQVKVAEKAKVASLAFDAYTTTLSTKDDKFTFTATVKDQYGENYPMTFVAGDVAYAVNGSDDATGMVNVTAKKVEFTPSVKGTYTIKITAGDLSRNLTIIVKEPSETDGVKSYRLKLDKTSIDMARNNSNDGAETVNVTFLGLDKNGLTLEKYVVGTDYSIAIKNVKNDTVSTTDSYDVVAVSGGAITKAEKTGSYTVTLTALAGGKLNDKAGKVVAITGFTVTDTQIKPVVKQEVTSIKASDIDEMKDILTVTTANKSENVEITDVIGYKVVSGVTPVAASLDVLNLDASSTYVITKVLVTETYDSNNSFVHEIAMSKTLKTN